MSPLLFLMVLAKVISCHDKILANQRLLIFQSRAKMNDENFQVLNLIRKQPTFKIIHFQIDKKIRSEEEMNRFDGTTRTIEKYLISSDEKKFDMKRDDDD